MNKGIIVSLIAGEYKIYDSASKIYLKAKPRGIFRIKTETLKVGDHIEYEIKDGSTVITKLDKRINDLTRPMIANIEQAFVVFSVKEPDLNLNLLDRFLAILEYNQIPPIIVFNKWDLLEHEEIKTVETIKNYYESIGYQTIKTSAKAKLIDELSPLIKDHISVITGQSGVGKSSLLNVLDEDLKLETNDISKALNRGKHTTRHVELINIKDGWIADTPGFGIMDLDMEELDLAHSFVEFFERSSNCKYNGCLHLNEPNCAVKKALEKGEILSTRYENYKQFIEEIRKRKKW